MSRKPTAALSIRRDWVFDLDNTLYPAECDLFAQIDVRMTDYVSEFLGLERPSARALQKQYYSEHGTTLAGLMRHHEIDPKQFLDFVHDIDHSPLPILPDLHSALMALPGRKFVCTNGSLGHAKSVTSAMKIDDVFDGMFGIEEMDFRPKPAQYAFDTFVDRFDIVPEQAVFFEDLSRNLEPAHKMGFATVLVTSSKDWSHEPENARPAGIGEETPPYVEHVTDNLTGFLRGLF